MIYVSPDSSLLDAFCALHGNAIRRLLVVDVRRHNPLYTVTHLLLLRFIYAKVHAPAVCAFHPPATHTHTHPFNGPLSGTTRVSQYQRGKTSRDCTEARDSE